MPRAAKLLANRRHRSYVCAHVRRVLPYTIAGIAPYTCADRAIKSNGVNGTKLTERGSRFLSKSVILANLFL